MTSNKQLLTGIARDHLQVPTLDARNSDSLDFHTVAVWSITDALDAAFEAGVDSAQNDATTIDIHQLLEQRNQVAVIWSVEDVQSVRSDLSDDQSWDVLQRCIKVHDCEIGFNWLLIQYVADDLFPSTKDGGGQ